MLAFELKSCDRKGEKSIKGHVSVGESFFPSLL